MGQRVPGVLQAAAVNCHPSHAPVSASLPHVPGAGVPGLDSMDCRRQEQPWEPIRPPGAPSTLKSQPCATGKAGLSILRLPRQA